MRAKHIKQIIVGCFSLGLLGASVVLAADSTVCSPASSLGSVFSTLPGGGVTMLAQSACNPTFFGNSTINTASFNNSDKCSAFTTQAEADSGKTTTKVTSTGSGVAGPVLPTYVESPETFKLYFTKAERKIYEYDSAGNQIRDDSIVFANGQAVVTLRSGRSFTITSEGTVDQNSAHTLVLPAGDYGEIEWQTLDGGGLEGIKFSGSVRAKYIHGGSCNANGKVVGLSFAQDNSALSPEYRQQTYINRLAPGSGCNWYVEGPGKTSINILGKETLSSTAFLGMDMSQASGCINYEGCPKKDWATMASQHPERLQINLYNGEFKASDSTYIAAGVYVPNGDAKFTAASNFVIVGEVLAKNIEVTQNNGPVYFFGKSTSTASFQNKYYSLTPPKSDRTLKTGDLIYRATQRDYRSDGKTRGTSGHLMAFAMKADSSHDEVPVWDAADPAIMTNRAAVIQTEVGGWAAAASDFTALDATYGCIIDPRPTACRLSNDPRDLESLVGVPWRTEPIIVGNSVLFATDDGILYSVNKSNGKLNWGWIPSQILAMTQIANARVEMASKHPWGQIGSTTVVSADGTSKSVYVTGSALGGQLHFSIEIAADGTSLKNVAWIDYQTASYSPGSLTINVDGTSDNSWPGYEGRPYGGAAPIQSFVDGSLKVAYVTDNKLHVRNVDGSDSSPVGKSFVESGSESGSTSSPAITASSNLLYMDDSQIFFGAANGKVYQSDTSGSLDTSTDGVSSLTLGTTPLLPVWFVNGSRLVSGSGSALMLTAQTKQRTNVLKYAADKWSLAWWSGLSATGVGESSDATAETIPVTVADDAQITAPASIRNGQIILYYTKGVSGCSPEAYSFGPLHLEDGSSALSGAQFRFKDVTSLSNYLGVGQATGGNDVIVNGKDGVLAGSSGTTMESGNTGILTNSGADNRKRLNWRELTNFF